MNTFAKPQRVALMSLFFSLNILIISLYGPTAALLAQGAWGCDAAVDYMVEGETAVVAGDYETASAAYACAIEIDPANYAAYIWRGALAVGNGDYDQLGYDLNSFMTQRTGKDDPMRLTIVRALPALNTAVKERPDDPNVYLLRGLALMIADLQSDADFDRLIELSPDNAAGYLFSWFLDFQLRIPNYEDERFITGSELAADSVLLDWIMSFASVDIAETMSEINIDHFGAILETNPNHLFAYAARGMAHIYLGDVVAGSHDYYQHIQNLQTEIVEAGELPLETEMAIDAVAGDVYRMPFWAEAGQHLSLLANRDDAGVFFVFPITAVLLDPAGNLIEAPYEINVRMGGTTTPIVGFEVPESGEYTLLLTPNYSGSIEVAITES